MAENTNKKQTSKHSENLYDETQAMNALAKALIVRFAWSMADLQHPNHSKKTQSHPSKICVNLHPLAE